jgi:hypothetical protein
LALYDPLSFDDDRRAYRLLRGVLHLLGGTGVIIVRAATRRGRRHRGSWDAGSAAWIDRREARTTADRATADAAEAGIMADVVEADPVEAAVAEVVGGGCGGGSSN